MQAGDHPFVTAIEWLTILRSHHERRPNHLIFKSPLCITVQGAKCALFGDQRFDYRQAKLCYSVEMPTFRTTTCLGRL